MQCFAFYRSLAGAVPGKLLEHRYITLPNLRQIVHKENFIDPFRVYSSSKGRTERFEIEPMEERTPHMACNRFLRCSFHERSAIKAKYAVRFICLFDKIIQ